MNDERERESECDEVSCNWKCAMSIFLAATDIGLVRSMKRCNYDQFRMFVFQYGQITMWTSFEIINHQHGMILMGNESEFAELVIPPL